MPSKSRTRSPSTSLHRRQPRLTPTTLSIPASRVRKTWRPLPQPAQERVKALLLAIQSQTLASLEASTRKGGKKSLYRLPTSTSTTTTTTTTTTAQPEQNDYSTAITTLMSRLTRSIPKMTFPPTSSAASSRANNPSRNPGAASSTAPSDADLSLEATLQRTATLAAQLAQATQSSKMLKMQLRAEEADLRRDREELRGLEENMRRANAVGREREREGRLHWIATAAVTDGGGNIAGVGSEQLREHGEGDDLEGIYEDVATAARPRATKRTGLGKAEIEKDGELKTLTDGLRSHLGSMRANTAGMDGVRRELRRAERELRLWEARKGVVI